ncbi:hypothetical protein ABBQ38_010567 [Trebouxia sp. C0009 RCD-2024]
MSALQSMKEVQQASLAEAYKVLNEELPSIKAYGAWQLMGDHGVSLAPSAR